MNCSGRMCYILDFGGVLYIAILAGILSAFACYYMAIQKNKDAFSWAIGGLFLGIIAILILALSKDETAAEEVQNSPPPVKESKQCPDCAETVLKAARKCKHCGFEFFKLKVNE